MQSVLDEERPGFMKIDKSIVLILLVFSLFCGVFIIALGIASEFPSINKIMAPLVCAGREQLEVTSEYNVSHPGHAVYDGSWLCVDEIAGNTQDASLKTILISGLAYGLLIFATFITRLQWANKPELISR
jgi:hypothetical protein